MNESGLVASLTFGGRKITGPGFGIPFILRYVLEFCSDVPQAVEVLSYIPSHMAYNVVVLDKSGDFKTIQLAPDQKPVVLSTSIATNHQYRVDWPEYARFSKTIEREKFLQKTVSDTSQQVEDIVESFMRPPLYSRLYGAGFGTIYTALYQPTEGRMELRWPKKKLQQSFLHFREGVTPVSYSESPVVADGPNHGRTNTYPAYPQAEETAFWIEYGRAAGMGHQSKANKY
jgi:predicted choloylglycine hydrolase